MTQQYLKFARALELMRKYEEAEGQRFALVLRSLHGTEIKASTEEGELRLMISDDSGGRIRPDIMYIGSLASALRYRSQVAESAPVLVVASPSRTRYVQVRLHCV